MWHPVSRLKRLAREAAARRIWRARPLSWRLRSGVHIRLESYAEWVIYNDIFVDGEYDWALKHAFSRAKGRPFIVDLGANVGLFACRAMDRALRGDTGRGGGDLLLVEGSPTLAKRLAQNMKEPPGSFRVEVQVGLVGLRAGSGVLCEGAFHIANRVSVEGEQGTAVPYLDLESVIQKERRIDLLKCDIEGSELRFVEAYPDLLQQVDCAVFEFHPEICDVEACRSLIVASGLRNTRVERMGQEIAVEVFWR